MKLKLLIGWSLILAFLLAGNIILFGMVGLKYFAVSYILFAIVSILIILYSLRHVFEYKQSYLITILLSLLIIASSSFCAISVKSYHETLNVLLDVQSQADSVYSGIQQKNDYYTQYALYIQDEIIRYRNSSNAIQLQIDKTLAESDVLRKQNAQPVVQPDVLLPEEIVTDNPVYENDDRGETDD